jgi:SAM-dependent methyltransferase
VDFDPAVFYDEYPRLEDDFQAALTESLAPRGPDMLYDLVAALPLAPGSRILDVGCGEGEHSHALAARFAADVLGIDPLQRHLDLAAAAGAGPGPRPAFRPGTAEDLPVPDAAVDLIWCRDVLVHVADLPRAYAEFRRALRPGGHAVIYQMFATDLLHPAEAAPLFRTLGVVPASADPARTDEAIAAAGLTVSAMTELGSEWGEAAEESSGKAGRALLHAARLRRDPGRYRARFGRRAYDIMLADCHWHIYRMLGKLSGRAYVLTRPG